MSLIDRAKSAATAAIGAWRGDDRPVGSGVQVLASEVPIEDRTPAEIVAGVPPTMDRYPRVLGSNMTPGSLSSAQRLAHIGYMQPISDLLSEQRSKVTHLQSVMGVRSAAVAGRSWLIVPPDVEGVRRKQMAADVANYVRRRLAAASGTPGGAMSFKDGLKCLADGGPYFGRAGLETQFKRDSQGIGVAGFHLIHARRLSYTGGWKLRLYDASGNDRAQEFSVFPGVDIRARYPGRFILHEPKTSGAEYQTRQGVGYALLWTSLFWNWSVRDWMKYLELFGKPWRVGSYDKSLANADITALYNIVKKMSGGSAVALPAGADMKLLSPSNASESHAKMRIAMNAEISKVALGQTGTTELGDVGSFAATKVHDLVRGDILQDDGCSLSETITRDLVRSLVALQFGEAIADELCPNFVLQTQPEESLVEEFKRAIGLVDRGVPMGTRQMRERYTRLAPPEDDEELAQPLSAMRPTSTPESGAATTDTTDAAKAA